MPITANQLTKQVDLPVWEWTRPLPVVATAGLSAMCNADNTDFNEISGRYVYLLLNATNFWRYDTVADSYQQLASPGITPLTATYMQFAGAQGYYGRVISSTATTLTTGLPNNSCVGFRIRILSGKGAGQERIITNVSQPIVADWGGVSTAATVNITDAAKAWTFNNWLGYVVRTTGGTGLNAVRKILYNNATQLIIADPNIYAWDTNAVPMSPTAGTTGMAVTAAGTQYQIEASVITVDTAWSVEPDSTSRYVIQSGGIWLASGATVAGGGVTMQYYSVLEDIWYAKSVQNAMVPIVPTDLCLERFTENSSLWYTGKATSGNTTTLTDTTASWTANQWSGYYTFIWTGTGKAQLASIANNTQNQLNFSTALGTGLDSTSRYNILGYDAGTLTSSEGRVVTDTSKTWEKNRWANYAVRIIAGTGDGQMRQIMSNGTDSLVVYEPWNVQPDNTSIYAIQAWTDDMLVMIGGNAETFIYHVGDSNMISHGRVLDEGTIQVACAMLVDGTSTASHVVYEQKPVAITSLAGTTTITATTPQPHQFKAGQWVSIRGVTSAAADIYNVTGKVQIATVPSSTTFTYVPNAAGTGTYQYSENATVGVSVLPDASKHFADLATGGSTTTVTFSRATPTNINGWYAYGTNVAAGAQVLSGAGTTTLTFNLTGAGTPSGTIVFTKWPRAVTLGAAGGGGANVFTATSTSTIPAYTKGWLVTATNVGIGAYLTGGEGTTTGQLSIQAAGAVSGTFTLSHPVNNPLPNTVTYSSNANTTSLTFTGATPSYINGWWVSGTNIGNGSKVVSGEGTSTVIVSTPHAGTPSGTITFYPPTQVPAMLYAGAGAPANAATGLLVAANNNMQLAAANTLNGSIMTPISALLTAPTAGLTRYVVAKRDMIGQHYAGQNLSYLSGVAVGTQAAATLVDTNSLWGATGSGGGAGQFTFTVSAIGSILHNGWYVSGTGIPLGARVVSGGGTTSITIDTPMTAAASGTITFTAWSAQGLIGRRLRVVSSTAAANVNQEQTITSLTTTTGTIGATGLTAPGAGVATYMVLPTIVPGTGSHLRWTSDSSVAANRGRNVYRFRGSTAIGVDRIDLTTDLFYFTSITPNFELLSTGSMYAYDGKDRIYFTRDVTNRVYYLDLNTNMVFGAGVFPYVAGTAGIGNLMEVFKTIDGLKYVWVNRKAQVETFRQLIFY
jgi:hypothetical protein